MVQGIVLYLRAVSRYGREGRTGRKKHTAKWKYPFSKQPSLKPKSEIESAQQNLYNFSTCP